MTRQEYSTMLSLMEKAKQETKEIVRRKNDLSKTPYLSVEEFDEEQIMVVAKYPYGSDSELYWVTPDELFALSDAVLA